MIKPDCVVRPLRKTEFNPIHSTYQRSKTPSGRPAYTSSKSDTPTVTESVFTSISDESTAISLSPTFVVSLALFRGVVLLPTKRLRLYSTPAGT